MTTSPSEQTLASFNRLVYEYLAKMKLTKSAEAFKSECDVGEVRLNDSLPVLLNWYNIFLETADVRSGRAHSQAALNRIEGIMLKLENEKSRCVKMSSIVPQGERRPDTHPSPGSCCKRSCSPSRTPPGAHARGHGKPSPQNWGYHPPAEVAGPRAPVQVPPYGRLKECKRLELSIPFILIASMVKCMMELSCYLPHRQVGGLKVLEAHDSIFLLMDFPDNSVLLLRYACGQREDLYKFRLEEPVRSYCFGNNVVFVLTESATLRIYSFTGEVLRTLKVSASVFAIDYFGKNLLLVEPARIVEFDASINMEIKTLGHGTHPSLFVKDEFAILSFTDSIQVFNRQSPFPVITLKSSLAPNDMDLAFNRVVVAAGNEIYCGNDILSLPNTIMVSNCTLQDVPLLLALTSDGSLVLFAANCINEYI